MGTTGTAVSFGTYPGSSRIITTDTIQWRNKQDSAIQQNVVLKVEKGTTLDDYKFSSFRYGQEVKLFIQVADKGKQEINVAIHSAQGFLKEFDKLQVSNGEAETPLFYIPLSEYDESIEKYNYTEHSTIVEESKIITFYASVDGKEFKNQTDMLIPYTYRRNYEELIGLFNKDNTGNRSMGTNYENYFIGLDKGIEDVVEKFCTLFNKEYENYSDILNHVKNFAPKLWEQAVKNVQGGSLDDRPLYWARNKMQVWLKRNPFFIGLDIDFEKSRISSTLSDLITLFEEKSRNYTGIDFSKAPPGAKKVLITGFDPFVLNSIKYRWANINTQNPSGISALYFHGKTIGNAFIQTAIVPVRYEDFDNGIVENLVQNNIATFDIMMTMSRNDENFDLERFACKFRGAFFDNMNIGVANEYVKQGYPDLNNGDWDQSRFFQINKGNEFYETTLPISKILTGDLEASKNVLFFDQSIKDDTGFEVKHPNKGGSPNTVVKSFSISSVLGKSIGDSGSGGDYLSNEIMYRATKKRDDMKMYDTKQIGHVHIANNPIINFTNIITKIIENATK